MRVPEDHFLQWESSRVSAGQQDLLPLSGTTGGLHALMSAPRFVESVLLAEFDIDKGSVLRLQYPEKVSEDEGLLAELMMPEGVHNHFQDWTVFMLNRPAQAADAVAPKRWPVHAYRYDTALAEPEWVMATAGREGGSAAGATHWATIETPTSGAGALPDPPLLVVDLGGGGVQLRITHHDELQYSALQDDFVSLYTYDGEAVGLHFRSAAQQAEFKAALDAAAARAAAPPTPMLWCLNHVSNRRDKTVRRGAQVKALTVCSRFQFVHVWKPILLLAVDRLYSTSVGLGEYSETPLEQCRYLYDALNALPLAVLPPVSDLQRHAHRLLLAQGVAQKELTHVGHVQWQQSAIPLRVPLLLQPQELLDASVGDLLRRFKAGLLPVFHAILGRKRVLFLGHAQPAETVCAAVLSAPLLVCPPESAVLPRCFPYTTLNNLDFLSSPGCAEGAPNRTRPLTTSPEPAASRNRFIAGSTNPIFESHPEWWDVLCDIDAGKVVVSALGDKGKPTVADAPKLGDADAEVLEQALAGVDAHYSECARARSPGPGRAGRIAPRPTLRPFVPSKAEFSCGGARCAGTGCARSSRNTRSSSLSPASRAAPRARVCRARTRSLFTSRRSRRRRSCPTRSCCVFSRTCAILRRRRAASSISSPSFLPPHPWGASPRCRAPSSTKTPPFGPLPPSCCASSKATSRVSRAYRRSTRSRSSRTTCAATGSPVN